MPNDDRQDGDLSNSNEDYSVRGAANHCIYSPNTDSGPGHIHEPVSFHGSPNAAFQTTNPVSTSSRSSSNRKKSHHQKRKPKRTRSSVSEMSLSLTALSISSDLVATSSSHSEPPSRQRTFSRTQASSTLTNISNIRLTPATNSPPPQFTFVPVESDVPARWSDVNASEDLNPFSSSPLPSHPISVMFPSFPSSIDAVLEDNTFKGIQVEIDPLGCAILPPSEYTLSLESESKFHYSFWDSDNQIHFCIPLDLALRLDPSRASLYHDCPLALPPISQVAVRFSTVTCQTRFSRLVPKPTQPVPPSAATIAQEQQNTTLSNHPNQPYVITYRGAAVKSPGPLYKKSDKSEITVANGIHLSAGWERTVDGDDDSCPKANYQRLRQGHEQGAGEDAEQESKRGFSIRAWIPVPVSLFANKETCTFRMEARVGIEDPFSLRNALANGDGIRRFGRPGVRWDVGSFDDEPKPSNVVFAGRMLEASAEVTVSHLHSTKEMV